MSANGDKNKAPDGKAAAGEQSSPKEDGDNDRRDGPDRRQLEERRAAAAKAAAKAAATKAPKPAEQPAKTPPTPEEIARQKLEAAIGPTQEKPPDEYENLNPEEVAMKKLIAGKKKEQEQKELVARQKKEREEKHRLKVHNRRKEIMDEEKAKVEKRRAAGIDNKLDKRRKKALKKKKARQEKRRRRKALIKKIIRFITPLIYLAMLIGVISSVIALWPVIVKWVGL